MIRFQVGYFLLFPILQKFRNNVSSVIIVLLRKAPLFCLSNIRFHNSLHHCLQCRVHRDLQSSTSSIIKVTTSSLKVPCIQNKTPCKIFRITYNVEVKNKLIFQIQSWLRFLIKQRLRQQNQVYMQIYSSNKSIHDRDM